MNDLERTSDYYQHMLSIACAYQHSLNYKEYKEADELLRMFKEDWNEILLTPKEHKTLQETQAYTQMRFEEQT